MPRMAPGGEYFDDDRLVLTMAYWLHDIGKVATPLKVMNKATLLGEQFPWSWDAR